jgi:hypothetical protein
MAIACVAQDQAAADPEAAAPAENSAKENTEASSYYVSTEGTLLGEFGSFLGQLADRIDEQMQRQAGQT